MPIIIKARGNDSTNDVIKRFKKVVSATNIVQNSRDRQYFVKPSQERQVKKTQTRRLRKRLRSLKKTKNANPESISRISKML